MRTVWTRSMAFAFTVAGAMFLANCEEKAERGTPAGETDKPPGYRTTQPETGEQGPMGPAADGGVVEPGPGQRDAAMADAGTADAGTMGGPIDAGTDGGTIMPDAGTQLDRGTRTMDAGTRPTR